MKSNIKLVVFDLDDTLTRGPTIWELVHKENDTWHSHGIPFYQAFRNRDFGFNAFIKKDVAGWRGMKMEDFSKAINKVKFLPGLGRTIKGLNKLGIKTAIVSSGLEELARSAANKFGIDYCFANKLGIKNGRLTGQVQLKVPGKGKGRVMRLLKKKLRIKKNQVMAIGDSSFDFPMFREAGISVTFSDARENVKQAVDFVISKRNITRLIDIATIGK